MGHRDDVRAGGVNLGVHGERGLVHMVAALEHLAVRVGQHQIADGDVPEGHPEGVDPEAVGELGVARGDVPRDPVLEAEPAEQAQGAREAFLAVPAFVLDRLVHRRHGELQPVGGQGRGRRRPVHRSSSTGFLVTGGSYRR